MSKNKESGREKHTPTITNSLLGEACGFLEKGSGQEDGAFGAVVKSVEAMRAEAIEQSGLLHLVSVPDTLCKMSRDQAMFHLNRALEIMKDQIAVWTPYRPGSPKPKLRFHMKTGKNECSGTATLEGDYGAWGFFAIFEDDRLFGELYQYGASRVDGAYKIHGDGIEARFPGSEARTLRLI